MRRRPSWMAVSSSLEIRPHLANIAAWAREPWMSWAARRLSKPMETLIACISSAGFSEKRPPHIAWPARALDMSEASSVI